MEGRQETWSAFLCFPKRKSDRATCARAVASQRCVRLPCSATLLIYPRNAQPILKGRDERCGFCVCGTVGSDAPA